MRGALNETHIPATPHRAVHAASGQRLSSSRGKGDPPYEFICSIIRASFAESLRHRAQSAEGRAAISGVRGSRTRALRGIALGRKSWLFAGSDRGGECAAVMYTLIQTARLNDVDPQAWLADVLARINDHNIQKLDQLLPWNWKTTAAKLAA